MAQLIHLATIIGAHGIKGEVKVKSFTSDPKAFAAYGPLTDKNGHVYEVRKLRAQINDFICVLSNITDRNAADALRGTDLFVARDKLPPLKQGETYLSDLQGKQAVSDGKPLGQIIGFQNFGAGELLELESGMLIPISFIATMADTVTLTLPEGYLNEE